MSTLTSKRWPRGAAVLLVITLIPILIFLARSVAWLSQTTHFRTVSYREKVSATYILEAGLNHAATLLTEDATWTEGFQNEEMTRIRGSYSIYFQKPGEAYQQGYSVNNLMGTDDRDGPRGPKTVAPGTVELIVHSRSGPTENQGTFLLQAVFDDNRDWAVSSAGKLVMNGNVDVQGVANLETWAPVKAGVHSNLYQSNETAIEWNPAKLGDKATFTGKVSTTNRGTDALKFAGTEGTDYSAESFEDEAGRLSISSPDIVQEVGNHSSSPAPATNPFGETRLSSGDFYKGGPLELQGDLVLDGGTLYVNGDLTVNGSITGTGSVYVTGKTTFKGDAVIEAGAEGVALYSEGSITMSGFNGVEFVERLARDNPSIIGHFNNAKSQLAESADSTPDNVQRNHNNSAQNSIRQVSAFVDQRLNTANGQTAAFIKEQLASFDDAIQVTHADGTYGRAEMRPVHKKVAYGLDKLGTGYFKGLMVTNSYIQTDSAVAVVGAVWASGTNTEDEPTTVDGKEIKPGDIYLGADSSLLLNQALVDDEENGTPSQLAGLEMLAWRR